MTVRELKTLLADEPDDTRIYLDDGFTTFEGNSEVVFGITTDRYPGRMILQTKDNIDVGECLDATRQWFSENGYDEYDFFLYCGEHGFNLDDFEEVDEETYEWAKEYTKTHAWEAR